MELKKISEQGDEATVEVKLFDSKGVQCLDAINWINFGLTGDGKLLDNLGTSSGSRKVQAFNGRAIISIKLNKGKSVVSVKSEGLPTLFTEL
ncbi:hypothetical protein [Pedobacter jamesrossensis]|uniref:Glycoside hydrolase family 2 domain-containing protein n=1 Tax=Pedobacter jamesrossensis TaxID=1908238 RepID=A0ABV8NQ55_9SPHI